MKKTIMIILIVLILSGCKPSPNIQQTESPAITRYIDREAGVVCWMMTAGMVGGISCLPISETSVE